MKKMRTMMRTMISQRSKEEIRRTCDLLLNGYINDGALEVTLEEFREFYSTFNECSSIPPVLSIVNLENIVVVQFSNITPQHFDIVCDNPLTEKDFNYAKVKWYGRKDQSKNFLAFLRDEIRINKKPLIPIFIISFVMLFVARSYDFIQLIASFLIQSATVFLSLYIIFTVSQSQKLYKDIALFKSGILQKYYDDDQNVTILGIVTIAFVFLCSGMAAILNTYKDYLSQPYLQLAGDLITAVLFAITITMLFDTFLAVASYYLHRSRDVIERDIVTKILKDDYVEDDKPGISKSR